MEEDHKELQLLPTPLHHTTPSLTHLSACTLDSSGIPPGGLRPSLDLQLSISLQPIQARPPCEYGDAKAELSHVEALKWQAAEEIRLAAIEKGYAERVRELTRREMEMAQKEFARARYMWERAREEVEKAERMKERMMTHQAGSTCMEITCQACRKRFRPQCWNLKKEQVLDYIGWLEFTETSPSQAAAFTRSVVCQQKKKLRRWFSKS